MGLQAQCLSAGCLGRGTWLAHASVAASGNSQVAPCGSVCPTTYNARHLKGHVSTPPPQSDATPLTPPTKGPLFSAFLMGAGAAGEWARGWQSEVAPATVPLAHPLNAPSDDELGIRDGKIDRWPTGWSPSTPSGKVRGRTCESRRSCVLQLGQHMYIQ